MLCCGRNGRNRFFIVSCSGGKDGIEGRRPNILIAVADDQSYPHAGAYGCHWVKTPAFDRVASVGLLVRFARAPQSL